MILKDVIKIISEEFIVIDFTKKIDDGIYSPEQIFSSLDGSFRKWIEIEDREVYKIHTYSDGGMKYISITLKR